MSRTIPALQLVNGTTMPVLGLGTWHMGERHRERWREIEALKLGIELGMSLIDTAEMYGDGGAEEVVAQAIAGQRDKVFLVSKVYPHNASRRGTMIACDNSLAHLATDHLDLYLLHWRGNIPLAETVAGFEALRAAGKIRAWGVSNFDRADMEELLALPGGEHCAVNQVLYNLNRRGIEWDLLPLCLAHGIAIMAYSPVGQGKLLHSRKLISLAQRIGITTAQLALAWLLTRPGVAAIPKAADIAHVHDNRAAVDLKLTPDIVAELERVFPPPSGRTPLDIL